MLGDIFLWLVANVNLGKQACGSDKRAGVYAISIKHKERQSKKTASASKRDGIILATLW